MNNFSARQLDCRIKMSQALTERNKITRVYRQFRRLCAAPTNRAPLDGTSPPSDARRYPFSNAPRRVNEHQERPWRSALARRCAPRPRALSPARSSSPALARGAALRRVRRGRYWVFSRVARRGPPRSPALIECLRYPARRPSYLQIVKDDGATLGPFEETVAQVRVADHPTPENANF